MPASNPHRPTSLFASLRARLLALALCCLLPGLVVVVVVGIVQYRYERMEARKTAQRLTSVVAASQLHLAVASRELLQSLALDPRVRGSREECSKYLAEVLRLNPTYANLGRASSSGEVDASAVSLTHPVQDADREWFQRAIATRDFAYGSYVISRVLDKPTLTFAYPLLSRDGKIDGVLFASLGLAWFETMEDRLEVPEGSTLAILDNNGAILDSHPHHPRWAGSLPFDRSALDSIRHHHGGSAQSASLDGGKRLWAVSPLFEPTAPGGYVAIGIPVDSAFAESNWASVWAIAALLFISGLGLIAAWAGSHVLVIRKVRKLVETSRLLAAGNLDARSGLSDDRGELGELGSSLDEMAAALGRREREIRVAERSMADFQRTLTVQQAVTKALADSRSTSEAAKSVLASIGQGFGWDVGVLWEVDTDSGTLRCTGFWSGPGIDASELEGESLRAVLVRGESGPGRAWATGEHYAGGIASGPASRIEAAALAGLHSTMAFPVTGGTQVVGVLELFSRLSRHPESPLESIAVLARMIGQSIVRRQSETTQARLLGILEMTSDLVGFASPDGRILYTNRAGRAMMGMGEDEDITKTQIADYYDAEVGRFMAEVVIPTAMRDGVWVGETPMRRRDGKGVQVSAVIMAHRPSGGEVEYVSIIARDITEKVKMEEQLRQAQKMEAVGSLAGGIAHDFNNLLTAIQGFSDLAMTRLHDPEALKRDLEEVRRASVRAAALTRQLLIFSRQEVLHPQPLSVNLLVTELAKMLRRLIGENIDLTLSCEEESSVILADPGQIEQVIINLVVNARDAITDSGQIVIETARREIDASVAGVRPGLKPGSYVLLSVSDTGSGMDAETQARIFEPFFTTKEPGKGTGLGLATVYGIVKQCEGDIQVLSEPGQGTVFNILLPRLVDRSRERTVPGAAGSARQGTETILVVEDEEAVRSLIRNSLSLGGYQVFEARDGTEAMAVQATIQGPIHLVICDMVMPVMNGPEVAARLTQARPDSKILFMSGYAEKSILRRGIGQGAFLHKPFGMETLARKVREVLDSVKPDSDAAAEARETRLR